MQIHQLTLVSRLVPSMIEVAEEDHEEEDANDNDDDDDDPELQSTSQHGF